MGYIRYWDLRKSRGRGSQDAQQGLGAIGPCSMIPVHPEDGLHIRNIDGSSYGCIYELGVLFVGVLLNSTS